MLEPKNITPLLLQKYGLLPARISIGAGSSSIGLNSSIPLIILNWVSMIKIGHTRPNIPEFPQITDYIRQAIEQVYNGAKLSKQALDEAAARSAKVLGWH
jgi:multiple sugar transport system substrate-binding protein